MKSDSHNMINDQKAQTSAIHKILDILLLFNEENPLYSIEQISDALDIPRSTVYRHIRLLCDKGFLERTGDGQYRIGMTLLRLGKAALNSNRELRLLVLPSMQRIAQTVRESVSLMRLFDKHVICIENIEGQYPLRVMIEPGRVQLLHTGASPKVILAHLPEDEWRSRLIFPLKRYTDATFTDFDDLQQELRLIRSSGYAVSNGEIDIGARAVAVAIRNHQQEVVAALSIEGPSSRMTNEKIMEYLLLLQQEVRNIENSSR
jgi:DNA-binding IclR family transcriptional regulator